MRRQTTTAGNGQTRARAPLTVGCVKTPRYFYGWNVVGAAFVLAAFGWGMGFYGPPVFLSVVSAARGWPLSLVSTAVTI